MDKRLFACVLAALAAAPHGLTAQTDTITLARAVAMARGASPRITSAAAAATAAGARVAPAGRLPDPQLTLGLMNRSLSGMTDPLTMNQVTLMEMVPVNGALGLKRRAAALDRDRASSLSDATMLEVERDVRARYWELYHTDQALVVMYRTLAVLRDLAATSASLYAVGTVPQSDVVRSQVAITRMEQEIQNMRLDRTRAAAELNAAMGRPAEDSIVLPPQEAGVEGNAAMLPLATPALPALDSLMVIADSESPLLGAARAMAQSSAAVQAAARRMRIPDLALGVSYGRRPGSGDNMVSLEVGASLPILGRQRAAIDEAGAMRRQAEADLAQQRLELRSQLLTARAQAETARQQIARVAGTLVPQASAAYEAALAAYRVGRADFQTVLEAQMSLLEFQHDVHSYEAAYGASVAEVDRLIGRRFAGSGADHMENKR